MRHSEIAGRVFNTNLLVEPSKAMAILSGLGGRILGASVDIRSDVAPLGVSKHGASTLVDDFSSNYVRRDMTGPYPVIDGVAVIAVTGSLVHRGAWVGESSGVTSYEGLGAQIDAAAGDPTVLAIALEIDSYGGEVAGAFDLADKIRSVGKPVRAFVSEAAYSAGYIIASQAGRIVVPRTGGVGSIGVVRMHADYSGALAGDGVAVTLIHSGLHKVDGNPYQPLPEEVFENWQAESDKIRVLFAETVAAGRNGKMTVEAALATQAALYHGQDAVDAGLADEVSDVKAAFGRFVSEVNGRSGGRVARKGVSKMASEEGRADAAVIDVEAQIAAAVEAAKAEASAQMASAVKAALDAERATVKADLDRRNAIMGHADAKGREKLAAKLADFGMSVEQAGEALALAPKSYSAAMDDAGGAGVGLSVEVEPAAPKAAQPQKVLVI